VDGPTSTPSTYPPLLTLAAHEFRTPASVVGGYLRMLQRDSDGPLTERQQKMISEAEKSCARVVEIVAQLSEIGKLDAGTAAVNVQPFDLFQVVDEVARTVDEGRDRDVHLSVAGDKTGAPMHGDLTRFRTAFASLFRSVLREQGAACTIVVARLRAAGADGGSAIITVAQEKDLQRVRDAAPGAFDEFRGGLGLALPIARRVIERHGGKIWSPALETSAAGSASDQPSRGAFVVALPFQESQR